MRDLGLRASYGDLWNSANSLVRSRWQLPILQCGVSMIQVFNQYVSPKNVLLMLLESCLIALALLCGVRIRFWNSLDDFAAYITLPEFALQALVFVTTLQVCFYYCQLYNANAIRSRNEQWIALSQ